MIRPLFIVLLLLSLHAFPQCVTVFPYSESFETSPGNWFTGGTNNDWAWATPVKPVITGAGAGVKCWITGGPVASFYNLGERSWVQSPCFDFTSLNKPFVSFLVFWETERTYDGGNFQYSTDGGTTWVTVGSANETDTCSTHNWYNASHITNVTPLANASQGWSGTIQPGMGACNGGGGSGGWKRATHCIENLAHQPSVKFRFTFGSGTTCNDYDGLAFDDIYIGEAPVIPSDFAMTCAGPQRVTFVDLYKSCHISWNWDFGDPSSPDNTSVLSNPVHAFSHGGTFDVRLSVAGGCSADTVVVKQLNILSYTTSITDVSCAGGSNGTAMVNVQNTTSPLTYSWSHDPLLNSPVASGLPAGLYTVDISDTFCTVEATVNISYAPGAQADVSLGNDTVICPGSVIILSPGHYSSYQWQDNSFDSVFVVRQYGSYSVTVTNSAGCIASDSIRIDEDCFNDIIIPNAFTPNGDGINEHFFVDGSMTSAFEISIFDRWGELVFKSPDRSTGWDGTAKGHPVQEGFYNYLVNYTIGKEERVKTGSVFVIR